MRITYDSLREYAEIAIRCRSTVENGGCEEYCPLFEVCAQNTDMVVIDNGEISPRITKGGE
jgi:hypothetical protein